MGNVKNELKSMFTEHWKYLAVAAACRLKLFDKIYEGQKSIGQLVQSNNWNSSVLMHLMKFLTDAAYIISEETGTYILTEKGDLLRECRSDGLYYACLNWAGEHLNAWQHIHTSIESGKSAFESRFNKPYFEYLNDYPDKLRSYHLAMSQYAVDDYKDIPVLVDFSIHRSIMDVGGGFGTVIRQVKLNFPHSVCMLFDLEEVLAGIEMGDVIKVSGNFFKEIPDLAEALILARIIHDWDDDKAAIIISNCFKALPERGSLYLIENCTDYLMDDLSLLSLNMAAMCQSYERSSSEYIQLCMKAGFTFHTQEKLNQLQTILIFRK